MPNLKLISATDTQYSASVLKSMNEQRNHGIFCDVTIIIQERKFRAHKTILSASSTYFHQLFSVAGQVIELNFIRAEIFEEILNYIYTSKIIRVRSDMLEELINAGQILGVKFIANLGSPLSQVKGLPGLSKEPENKSDASAETIMPIITESFSISAEEFNQTSRSAGNDDGDDSDGDVMFVSATTQKPRATEVIDLDAAEPEKEKSGAEKSGAEKPGAEKSGAEKSGEEKSGAEKSGGEKPGAEKSGAEKSGEEKSGAEKSGGEKPEAEKPEAEKIEAEKPEAAKTEAAKTNDKPAPPVVNEAEKDQTPVKTIAPKPLSITIPNPSLPSLPSSSPLCSPDSSSNNSPSPARMSSGSAPATPARPSTFTPESPSLSQAPESSDIPGVQKKHIAPSTQQGDFKIRLTDVSAAAAAPTDIPKATVTTKKTVTLNTATEIDSISSGCKVYANIGENTYDIVPVKEDPGEGGSKAGKGKRSLMATPLKPLGDKSPTPSAKGSPNRKKTKTELEDHYELIMDGKTFYVCIVCKRPYVCLTSLRRHFNTHSWEKKYPCRYCDKVFALAEYRTKHEIHHTGERRYQCLLCNQMFLNYQVLSTHCKQAHNQDPSGRKQKDDSDNNLYRLLPCKSVQMKPYSWAPDGEQGVPVISEDGSVHITPAGDGVHSSSIQSRMLNWDDIFVEPDAHMPPENHGRPGPPVNSPPQGVTEFDFVIPETY